MASYLEPGFSINFTAVEPGGVAAEFSKSVMSHAEQTGGILDDDYKPLIMMYVGQYQKRVVESDAVFQRA